MEIEALKYTLVVQTKQINELTKYKHNYLRALDKIEKLEGKIKELKTIKHKK